MDFFQNHTEKKNYFYTEIASFTITKKRQVTWIKCEVWSRKTEAVFLSKINPIIF